MTPEVIVALSISGLSLAVSLVALLWSMYRDVLLKARVRARLALVRIAEPNQTVSEGERYLSLDVVNYGPGAVKIEMIHGRECTLWQRLTRRARDFVVIIDWTNPLNPQLPHRLDVGDRLTLFMDPRKLSPDRKSRITHLGVRDSFGRLHFAPAGHVRRAAAEVKDLLAVSD